MSTNHEWTNGRRGNHRTVCERLISQIQANVRKSLRDCISANNASIWLIFGPQAAPELPFRLFRTHLHPVYPEIRILEQTVLQNILYFTENLFW